nr:hypothetical protein [Pseudomonas sp. BIGb0427]
MVTSSFYAAMFPDASFDNVDWNGQCDDERFEAIESLAEVLEREVGKSDDEFDVAIFMGALGGLLGHFTINYSPAIGVVVDKIQGEGGAKFSVPALETDAQAIYHAVRDVAGILVLLRSYLGVKGKRGPAVVDKYLRIKKLVEISKGKYSIIR